MDSYRGKIVVSNERLAELLEFPADIKISHVKYDYERDIITIIVDGEKKDILTPQKHEGAFPLDVTDKYESILLRNKTKD